MKKLYLIITIVFISTNLQAQQLFYQDTIPGSYTKSLIKIAQTYNNANNVIQFKDKEEGIIVLKAAFDFNIPFSWGANRTVDGLIYYSLTIQDIGNNTLIINMSNIEHRSYGDSSFGIITTNEEPNIKTIQTRNWRIKVYNRMKEYAKQNYLHIKSILNNN